MSTENDPVVPGNIDINNRPVVHNPDGSVSTELSFSIGTDQGEVLIPRVVGGQVLSPEHAIAHYRRTGEHLGIFNSPDAANRYAEALHNRNLHGNESLPTRAVDWLFGEEWARQRAAAEATPPFSRERFLFGAETLLPLALFGGKASLGGGRPRVPVLTQREMDLSPEARSLLEAVRSYQPPPNQPDIFYGDPFSPPIGVPKVPKSVLNRPWDVYNYEALPYAPRPGTTGMPPETPTTPNKLPVTRSEMDEWNELWRAGKITDAEHGEAARHFYQHGEEVMDFLPPKAWEGGDLMEAGLDPSAPIRQEGSPEQFLTQYHRGLTPEQGGKLPPGVKPMEFENWSYGERPPAGPVEGSAEYYLQKMQQHFGIQPAPPAPPSPPAEPSINVDLPEPPGIKMLLDVGFEPAQPYSVKDVSTLHELGLPGPPRKAGEIQQDWLNFLKEALPGQGDIAQDPEGLFFKSKHWPYQIDTPHDPGLSPAESDPGRFLNLNPPKQEPPPNFDFGEFGYIIPQMKFSPQPDWMRSMWEGQLYPNLYAERVA